MRPILLLFVIISSSWIVSPTWGKESKKHALLVGCTRYPELPFSMQLRGPENDVFLMKKLLQERFGFNEDHICTLTEGASATEQKPTRTNIVRELSQLAEVVNAGDQVVILLAGHGSQQPNEDNEDFEPDGLDEIFLPRDSGTWDGQSGTVKNAITDDELRVALRDIQEKDVNIWIIIDACHSGTMVRGGGLDERTRQVLPELIVPAEILEKAKQNSEHTNERDRGGKRHDAFGLAQQINNGSIVAIYAAQSTEPTVEKSLPPDADDRKPYGLLTYTINQVLTQASKPITYRELAQMIHQNYAKWGRTYPTPAIEGTACDYEILGSKSWKGRSQILLSQNQKGLWNIDAGAIHGITTGSILAAYASASQSTDDKPLGYVKVLSTNPLDASVVATEFDGFPKAKELPAKGRCEIVRQNYENMALRLALAPTETEDEDSSHVIRQHVTSIIKELASEEGSLVELSDHPTKAQWLLHVKNDEVYLRPSSGWITIPDQESKTSPSSMTWFGPVPVNESVTLWLRERLNRIARVKNLLTIANSSGFETRRNQGVNVNIELLLHDPKGTKEPEAVKWDNGRSLSEGDIVSFRVQNRGREPVDVTLLFIDSTYGITAFFPQPGLGGDSRIPAGKELTTSEAQVTKSNGEEHMLAIAVQAKPGRMPVDFTSLCQSSIESIQVTRGGQNCFDSPLGQLLQNAVFGRGGTRGLDCTVVDSHSLKILTWDVKGSD